MLVNVLWSDETCFKLSSAINHHNFVYYLQDNPLETIVKHLNHSWVINDVTVNGNVFNAGNVVPLIGRHCSNNLIFQKDGTTPHYSIFVIELRYQECPSKWIWVSWSH